jgi:hypothetical protein
MSLLTARVPGHARTGGSGFGGDLYMPEKRNRSTGANTEGISFRSPASPATGREREMSPRSRTAAIGLFLVAAMLAACASSTPDPRCRIDASGRHQKKIAKVVNASNMMQSYFDELEALAPGKQLVEVSLDMGRDRYKSYGGDYDPGNVTVTFKVSSLRGLGTLYEREEDVDLEPFMIGLFEKDATRDEVQEIAFKATEDKIYPYLARWVDLAAIRAMGKERTIGRGFVPMLNELIEDSWTSTDVKREAIVAVKRIEGSA